MFMSFHVSDNLIINDPAYAMQGHFQHSLNDKDCSLSQGTVTGHDKGKTTLDDTCVLLIYDATFCCILDNLRMLYHSYFFHLHLASRRVYKAYLTFVAALVDPIYQGCDNQTDLLFFKQY